MYLIAEQRAQGKNQRGRSHSFASGAIRPQTGYRFSKKKEVTGECFAAVLRVKQRLEVAPVDRICTLSSHPVAAVLSVPMDVVRSTARRPGSTCALAPSR